MDAKTVKFQIDCDEDVSQQIREILANQGEPADTARLIQRRNLSGDTATWILIATLGVQTLPHVLGFLKDLRDSKRVKRIKVGDIEIDDPTPEDLELLREKIRGKGKEDASG